MQIMNIAGYRFLAISDAADLCLRLQDCCAELELKGTILLSHEGININLAGSMSAVKKFQDFLRQDERFAGMTFRESFSDSVPFKFLKAKIRKEIITLRRDDVRPEQQQRAAAITPQQLKQWLDEKREITLLDTRNDYEVRFGTFENAQHYQLKDFSSFAAVPAAPLSKPIVMFCTGGIRCEKAALHLQNSGVEEVFQLEGGILNYFAEVGGAHYDGECFVFDQRVSVDTDLQETGTLQCKNCNGPISKDAQAAATYIPDVSCPACAHQQIA
jgi:UPF0176 protein